MIPGRGEIQGTGFNRGLVRGLHDRQRDTPGEDVHQVTTALARQVQDHDDRQCETLSQRTQDTEQRLNSASRRTDHNRFY
ncbi:hypothetical protein D3C76_1817840 [compost metagenome]